MISWYAILLYIHIFSVILTIGPYFTLFPLITKMRTAANDTLMIYIDVFRYVVRVTKHVGHVLVATGLLLAWMGGWSWKTPWIVATIVILIGSLLFLARAFSPTLRKLSAPDSSRQELVDKLKRNLLIYLGITLTMLWFMVGKPNFWG